MSICDWNSWFIHHNCCCSFCSKKENKKFVSEFDVAEFSGNFYQKKSNIVNSNSKAHSDIILSSYDVNNISNNSVGNSGGESDLSTAVGLKKDGDNETSGKQCKLPQTDAENNLTTEFTVVSRKANDVAVEQEKSNSLKSCTSEDIDANKSSNNFNRISDTSLSPPSPKRISSSIFNQDDSCGDLSKMSDVTRGIA